MPMSKLLAIESSASLCSIALSIDGKLSTREQDGSRTHTQYMLAFIDEVLQEQQCTVAELDAIVFSAGPGSFTGVRLATSVAKSLAYAANIPLVPVSSLAAIAQTVARVTACHEPCLVITDARMGEVYVAEYDFDESGLARSVMPDILMSLDQLQELQFQSKRLAGDALSLLQGNPRLSAMETITQAAYAQDLLLQGEQALKTNRLETALAAQAIYLRDKTSWKNISQQSEERQQLSKK
jgi:tRNA threonylcarbamoyladenosine biosynthesis protein TsaB